MKRRDFIGHLKVYGCEFLREGSRDSWWWNPEQNKRSSVPRHAEVKDNLAKKICKDLGISSIK
jgi:mRNA interferase HicA